MKKLLLVIIITLICTALSAQTDSSTIDTINTAKVFVIRSTGHVGSAVNFRIVVNDSMYCKIKNNRYAIFYVQPGQHTFYATSWDKSGTDEKLGLKLALEPGK